MTYAKFSTVPQHEQAVWQDGEVTNAPEAVKWGGKVPPPPIGAEITVTMNGLGAAIVTGYFVQEGWLGVLCTVLNPPEWHRRQNPGPNHEAHIFGPELEVTANG